MSWRLWNRETFCCEPQPHLATTPAIDVPLRLPSPKEVPELSASVESITSEKGDRLQARPIPRSVRRSLLAEEDSALSRSRGKEQHITAYGLEKMVISIKEKAGLEPLPPSIVASMPPICDVTPRPSSPSPERAERASPSDSHLQPSSDSCYSSTTANSATSHQPSDHRGSDTSVSSGGLIKSGSIVHGFSPSKLPASFQLPSALSHLSSSPLRSVLKSKPDFPKRSGMFTLGGSSGDDESSFEDRMSSQLKRASLAGAGRPLGKKASAQKEGCIEEADTDEEEAVESGEEERSPASETSEVSESAIDESDWEDSDEPEESSVDDTALFKRVDSQANLVSRRSMLTMQLHEPDQKPGLANIASRSSPALRRSRRSSPNGPSLPASPDEGEPVLTMRGPESSRPKAIITPTNTNPHSLAHSPRTTRRNMLATELPESLRKHLLWERQQKNTTAHAVFKRRHTAQNLAVLHEQAGGRNGAAGHDASRNNSLNPYYDSAWEYHAKGW
jgi:hypothetical protein